MKQTIFDYTDYRQYLKDWIATQPRRGRGMQRKLAEAAGCQATFISLVLSKDADLSQDHTQAICEFIGLGREESRFLHLLVQEARAGTPALKNFLASEIAESRERNLSLKTRLAREDDLTDSHKQTYYSSWHYGAVRVALSIPGMRTIDSVSAALGLSRERASAVLNFLVESGLATHDENEYLPTIKSTFLPKDSPLIQQHHANWRLKSLELLPYATKDDMHFSGVVSLSHADRKRIRRKLADMITEISDIVNESQEEELCIFCLDLQGL